MPNIVTSNRKKGTCGALLTNLSRAFDCLPHKTLLGKLNAHGFDEPSLKYMKNCLSDRKQKLPYLAKKVSRI